MLVEIHFYNRIQLNSYVKYETTVGITNNRGLIMNSENTKIVIFGASGGAVKVAQTLSNLNFKYEFFVDNDSRKWGKILEGKKVKSPEALKEEHYNIIIASDYQNEIEKQLEQMGMLEQLLLKEQLIESYIDQHIEEFNYLTKISDTRIQREYAKVYFSLEEGLVLGGIENWTFMMAHEFKKLGRTVKIITKQTDSKGPEDLQEEVAFFDLSYNRYWRSIKDLVRELAMNLPCVVVDNWQTQTLIAVSIMKRFCPDQIRCISVLHNDKMMLYRKTTFLEQYIDCLTGVSRDIIFHMEHEFKFNCNKLFYKESPVDFPEAIKKKYSMKQDAPLQIGYAARITVSQKRADLIVPFLMELESKKINYHINIAGDGTYFATLKKQIDMAGLGRKVFLLGKLSREEMPRFWEHQDLFFSISDYEGTSISMLEAMSHGVVPVVTEVSGVKEFVEVGVNGYAAQIQDIRMLANAVELLDNNRTLLELFGDRCREVIRTKCNKEEYISYYMNLLNEKPAVKISVVIPLYNAERYVKETLESVLRQSYSDFEIIIIDDCSTDNSAKIVEQMEDSRIRFYSNSCNMGIAYTRNKAIALSNGELIALLDDDDIAPPERFQKEVEYLEKHAEIDIVCGHCRFINERGAVIPLKQWNVPQNPAYLKACLLTGNIVPNGSAMIRKKFIQQHAIRYHDNMLGMEDYRFWVECSRYGTIGSIDDILLYWRIGHESETKRRDTYHKLEKKKLDKEIKRYALEVNGYCLEEQELELFHKVFFPEGDLENVDELRQLYTILYKLAKQAENMQADNCEEVMTLCRKKFGEKVGKAFFLWNV